MKKIYYLNSCSTNACIIKEINPGDDVELQNIKENNIDATTLDLLRDKVGSYEALFSKKAIKFRSMGLHEMHLTEDDYRRLMLEEYTFLKRPFIIHNDEVFVGNSRKVVDAAIKSFNS